MKKVQDEASTERVNRFVQIKKGKEVKSRAKLKSRPRSGRDCRNSSSLVCKEIGHRYVFDRFDGSYGFCCNCGDEILV